MNQNQKNIDEQKDILRGYIKVINKRKNIILTVLLVSVITTAIITFATPSSYRASASIMVLPYKLQTNDLLSAKNSLDFAKIAGIRDIDLRQSVLSISTHEELLKSNIVLERVINTLNLKDKKGNILSFEDFEQKLHINVGKDTNILKLGVGDSNPQRAKDIANAWANEYLKYIEEVVFEKNVKIVSPAFAPKYPLSENRKLKVAISAIISLMFGLLVAFSMEFVDKIRKK